VIGEVRARLPARVLRLTPSRRLVTVAVKGVGSRRAYAGAYAGASGELAPVADGAPFSRGRRLGRLVKVDPTAAGAKMDLVVADDSTWEALAAGAARVEAVVAFTDSIGGDPYGGRPVRIEIIG
jgi:hypothetical protein